MDASTVGRTTRGLDTLAPSARVNNSDRKGRGIHLDRRRTDTAPSPEEVAQILFSL